MNRHNYNELLLKANIITSKLKGREKLEKQLGLPVSTKMTEQWIKEELDEAAKMYADRIVYDLLQEQIYQQLMRR
tara:strand:+ start:65 stop:289 length:225 start_codon:yes stop_codon:yes gene_type:complete